MTEEFEVACKLLGRMLVRHMEGSMDFKQLKSFVTVAECGSFTAAASHLGVSQPTISTHLRMLEEELGQSLLQRNAKRVRLTESGAKVYEQAQAMLAMHDRMLRSVANRRGNNVALGASSIPASYILPRALAEYRSEYPSCRFAIHQGSSQDIADGVYDGAYDIGFVGIPVEDASISCTAFCNDRIVLITPNAAPYSQMDASKPLDVAPLLANVGVVMRDAGSGTRAETNRILREAGIAEANLTVAASLNDLGTIKNLVEHGFGVSFVSLRSVRNRVDVGRLLAFEIANADTNRDFYILRRKNASLSNQAEQFLAFMRLRHGSEFLG